MKIKQHRMHANLCFNCGERLGRMNNNRRKNMLCSKCAKNVDLLPEEYRCKGETVHGARCRTVVTDGTGYCHNHKHQEEEE
jgi:hypothetical protein